MKTDTRARPLAFVRRPRARWDGVRELAIFAAAYLTYFGVRALTEGSVPQALVNAGRIVHVERLAGVDWEDAAQSATAGTVQDLRRRADVVMTWPVQTPEQVRELVGWGVQGLITEVPELVATELSGIGAAA